MYFNYNTNPLTKAAVCNDCCKALQPMYFLSGEKNTGPLTRGKHTDTRWRSWPTKHTDRSFLLYKSTGLLPPKIQQFYISVLSVSVSLWKLDLLLPVNSLNSSFYIYWETKWMQSCLGVWSLFLLSVTTTRRKHDFCILFVTLEVQS